MTTKLYLDMRAQKADGTYPVKISISHGGRSTLIPIDVSLAKSDWDSVGQRVVGLPNRKAITSYLTRRKLDVDDVLMELASKGMLRGKTITEVRALVLASINPDVIKPATFMAHARKFAAKRPSQRTKEIYEATFAWIKKYDAKCERLTFEDVTKGWLEDFYAFMAKSSPSVNARNIHMRNIRAIFNDAIDDEITTCYPFRKFKIRPAATIKRSLDVDTLRAIFAADVPAWQQKYLDAFKLSFFLVGINMADLCQLPVDAIQNGRLEYIRHKTKRAYSLRVESEAAEIIAKYPGRRYLLNFAEGCASYRHFTSRLNLNLGEIHAGLTSYYARHTWATIAAGLDVPKETIAAALGHGGGSVTDIYINFDRRKVDDANRRVIDYVLGK